MKTGHYYNSNFEWVADSSDAATYESIERAIDIVANDRLDGMSVVVEDPITGAEQVYEFLQEPHTTFSLARNTAEVP